MSEQNKRSRGFNFYVRINLTSIQGRVTIPFVLAIILAIGLLLGTDIFWRYIQQRKDFLVTQIQPLANESTKLLNLVYHSQSNMNLRMFLNDPQFEKNNRELWLIDIQNQKDIIRNLVNNLNENEAKNIITILNNKLAELDQLQQRTEKEFATSKNTKLVQYAIKTELVNQTKEIEKSIQQLIQFTKIKEKAIRDEIAQSQVWFYRTLVLSLIIGFIICYIIGLQMFLRIFKWIREIRNHLKELSYGNLTEPLRIRNNEFKGVTIYINRINDNLRLLKDYAIEVGRGNFSIKTKIFGSQSTLGKHINEMGFSLQRVYDEEHKRNWTTEGLADFAEILRSNSQDLDNLCRETVRNLVKHLDAIQGGFFILNTDNEETPFFELKAAYAFGRDKFIRKQVEVSEGLLGRAYFEKERVYLKDIPANYSEITSGLGNTKPNTLIVLPLINDEEEIKGAIELASFGDFEEYQLDFLDKLCHSITATITVVIAGQKNQRLLEESQKITTTLRMKDEESRLNAEEISHEREESDKKLHQIQKNYLQTISILEQLDYALLITNEDGKIEQASPSTIRLFGYSTEEIVHRNITFLLPNIALKQYANAMDVPTSENEQDEDAIKKDGSTIWVSTKIMELRVENEKSFAVLMKEL